MKKSHLVVDVKRCTGCYSCEVACKQENDLPVGEQIIDVISIGPITVGEKPRLFNIPTFTTKCNLCSRRITQGLEPACVAACFFNAIRFVDVHEIDKILRERHVAYLFPHADET